MPDYPEERLATVTFEEQDGATKQTLRQNIPEAVAGRYGAVEGWNQSLDRLSEVLAG